ncbi:hypothetical protein HNV11_16465 [Spirosoma taeanense]|uniref:Uncharacterized protein n=1 Tax=Spirosoma taeanense TaxID=2735870 RepID=A0A6M5Y9A8_9BACT|nr:hypothetical protein [Spirosoma taeanense]QJW90857.1 hypothetical protein HNV11_16465 [Spirosoma taeanense]
MVSNQHEYIKINFAKKDKPGRAFLRVVTFKDGDYEIAYIPSLNLSGYGKTEQEAFYMLIEVVLKDYIDSLRQMTEAQVMAELREFGWERRPFLDKQLLNTEHFSLDKIAENFNLPAETEFHEKYVTA